MKRKNTILIMVGIILITITGLFGLQQQVIKDNSFRADPLLEYQFNSAIEEILSQKIVSMTTLAENELLISKSQEFNEKNKILLEKDFFELDSNWKISGTNGVMKTSLLSNEITKELNNFLDENPSFLELLVTDKWGGNTGMTNITSDYYQADKEWWIAAYNQEMGKKFHGPIEFNEGLEIEAISIYVPIYDPKTKLVIGIIKGIYATTELQKDLTERINVN